MTTTSNLTGTNYIYNFLMNLGKFNPLLVYQLGGQFFNEYSSNLGSWDTNRHQTYRSYLHQAQSEINHLLDSNQPFSNEQIRLRWVLYYVQAELINLDHLSLPERGLMPSGESILWYTLTHGFLDLHLLEYAPLQNRIEAIAGRYKEILSFLKSVRDGVTNPSLFWLIDSTEFLDGFPKFLNWLKGEVTQMEFQPGNILPSTHQMEKLDWGISFISSIFRNQLSNFPVTENGTKNCKKRLNNLTIFLEYRLGIANFDINNLIDSIKTLKAKHYTFVSTIRNQFDISDNLNSFLKKSRKKTLSDVEFIVTQYETQLLVLYGFFQKFTWFSRLFPSLPEVRILNMPKKLNQFYRGPVYMSIDAVQHRTPAQYLIPPKLVCSKAQISMMTALDLFPGHHFLISELLAQGEYPQRIFSFPETQKAIKLFLFYLFRQLSYPFSADEYFEFIYYRRERIILGYIDIMLCQGEFLISTAEMILKTELFYAQSTVYTILEQLQTFPGSSFAEIYILIELEKLLDLINSKKNNAKAYEQLMKHLTLYYNAPPIIFLEQLKLIYQKIELNHDSSNLI